MIAKLLKVTISLVMSACLHAISRLPPDRFSWHLVFEYFTNICQENSNFIKIWQE